MSICLKRRSKFFSFDTRHMSISTAKPRGFSLWGLLSLRGEDNLSGSGRQARIWGGSQRPDWMRGKGGRVHACAAGTFCLHVQVQQ